MAKPRRPVEALRKLLTARPPGYGTFGQLRNRLLANDRIAALVASTLVEHALEDAILSHFVTLETADQKKLFQGDHERDGAIGNFYTKQWLAFALGVYGRNTLNDLSSIRVIRNVFAHSAMDVSFDTPEIAEVCSFWTVNTFTWGGIAGEKPIGSRDNFIEATFLIWLYLSEDKASPLRYTGGGDESLARLFS